MFISNFFECALGLCQYDISYRIRIIHIYSLVRLKFNSQTMYVMESLGIIEMLGWYVVGFSTTIVTLEIVSRLNLVRRKEKKTAYLGSSYAALR